MSRPSDRCLCIVVSTNWDETMKQAGGLFNVCNRVPSTRVVRLPRAKERRCCRVVSGRVRPSWMSRFSLLALPKVAPEVLGGVQMEPV